jgi:spore germination protein YaaH
MDTFIKNDLITKEFKKTNFDIDEIIDGIEGDITTEKIYVKIFSQLGLNLYIDKRGLFYVELKRYVENLTNSKCKENQIVKNKFAVDKEKVKKLSEIEIEKKYEINKLTSTKKIIEISGLQTVNDSIKRFGKELNQTFFNWEILCQKMILIIPRLIESAVKKYLEIELEKVNSILKYQQKQIEDLKRDKEENHKKYQSQIDEIKNFLNQN